MGSKRSLPKSARGKLKDDDTPSEKKSSFSFIPARGGNHNPMCPLRAEGQRKPSPCSLHSHQEQEQERCRAPLHYSRSRSRSHSLLSRMLARHDVALVLLLRCCCAVDVETEPSSILCSGRREKYKRNLIQALLVFALFLFDQHAC